MENPIALGKKDIEIVEIKYKPDHGVTLQLKFKEVFDQVPMRNNVKFIFDPSDFQDQIADIRLDYNAKITQARESLGFESESELLKKRKTEIKEVEDAIKDAALQYGDFQIYGTVRQVKIDKGYTTIELYILDEGDRNIVREKKDTIDEYGIQLIQFED